MLTAGIMKSEVEMEHTSGKVIIAEGDDMSCICIPKISMFHVAILDSYYEVVIWVRSDCIIYMYGFGKY